MTIAVGDVAPEFELASQDRSPVRLSSFRGDRPVVVVFYPFAFTSICESELCSLRDDHSAFERAGSQVLAIYCDSNPSLARWSREQGWNFPVLSDFWPHGAVAASYGVFDEALGCARRATFVIDLEGKVIDTFESGGIGTAPGRQPLRGSPRPALTEGLSAP